MHWTDRVGRRLRLRDLHILLAVAKAGSMGKAAVELAMSQPSVSKAIADLDESLRIEPTYAWAWAVRAETYRLRNEYDRAIFDCNEALKIRPNLAQALATRGAAFRQKGDFATALNDLRQAIRIDPGNQFARDQQRLAEQRRK